MTGSNAKITLDEISSWTRSYAGCDGGNVRSDTWLCGIEHGGKYDNPSKYYQEVLVETIRTDIQKGDLEISPRKTALNWVCRAKKYLQYDKRFVKLHAAMQGKKFADQGKKVIEEIVNIHAKEMNDDNEILKLNLSPIGFENNSSKLWEKYKLDKITNLKNKSQFIKEILPYRSEFFTKQRKEYRPKRIICVGKKHLNDFPLLFGYDSKHREEIWVPPDNSDKSKGNLCLYRFEPSDGSKTILFVTPFLSFRWNCLNDGYLEGFGRRIAELSK